MDDGDEKPPKKARATSPADGGGAGGSSGASGEGGGSGGDACTEGEEDKEPGPAKKLRTGGPPLTITIRIKDQVRLALRPAELSRNKASITANPPPASSLHAWPPSLASSQAVHSHYIHARHNSTTAVPPSQNSPPPRTILSHPPSPGISQPSPPAAFPPSTPPTCTCTVRTCTTHPCTDRRGDLLQGEEDDQDVQGL